MACTSGEYTAEPCGGAATISAVHPDVIEANILTRLVGASLASAAATCSELHALSSSRDHLWSRACHATWPSTSAPRVRHLISMFPNGSRSFFSDSFTASRHPVTTVTDSSNGSPKNPVPVTTQLISAVDIFHGQDLILSKVIETETETGWFRCSPFRVDLLDPKETVPTCVKYGNDTCRDMIEGLRLSWILIDPAARRAVNVASRRPVSVRRHWLTGEVEARFATVVSGGERGTAAEAAVCGAVVTWGVAAEGREMHVREVSLQIEDMDGTHLNGRDSLVILKRALEGKRVKAKVEEEEERYEEFVRMKEERKEMKVRIEGRLDMLCVGLAALSFAGLFGLFVFWRWNTT